MAEHQLYVDENGYLISSSSTQSSLSEKEKSKIAILASSYLNTLPTSTNSEYSWQLETDFGYKININRYKNSNIAVVKVNQIL